MQRSVKEEVKLYGILVIIEQLFYFVKVLLVRDSAISTVNEGKSKEGSRHRGAKWVERLF